MRAAKRRGNMGRAPNGGGAGVPSARGLLAWMVKSAYADGIVSPQERQMLAEAAAQRGISEEQLQTMLSAAEQGTLETHEPADFHEAARVAPAAMAGLALADGSMTDAGNGVAGGDGGGAWVQRL